MRCITAGNGSSSNSSANLRQLKDIGEALEGGSYGLLDAIHWLEPLDMAFLPKEANLLTTLLVRIRNALGSAVQTDQDDDGDQTERGSPERRRKERDRGLAPFPSLLEEGEELRGEGSRSR